MKRYTDAQLKRLFRRYPIGVKPVKKEAFLERMREMQNDNRETGGKFMQKRYWKPILVTAIVMLCLTMLISAGAIVYYYRAPGGELVDESGKGADVLAETDSAINDRSIRINEDLVIVAVTWAQAEKHTTLAVWVNGDSVTLENLVAVVEGVEYPLEKKTFHLSGGQIGYTAVDVPKPEMVQLRCDSPAFAETVTFSPENIMTETTVGHMTLFGSTAGNSLYLGISDDTYLDNPIFTHAELSLVTATMGNSYVTDNEGNTYLSTGGGSATRSEDFLTFQQYDIPAGNHIVSLYTDTIDMIYYYPHATEGLAPTVQVPLPAVGETLTGNWVLMDDGRISFVITEVSRPEEGFLTLHVPDGVAVTGEEYGGGSCIVDIAGEGSGSKSAGGGGDSYEIRIHDGSLADWVDEEGAIVVCVQELRLYYSGEWVLAFGE